MTVSIVGHATKTSKFPGGESHFELSNIAHSRELIYKNPINEPMANIRCEFTSNDDLFLIAMAADALRKVVPSVSISLYIPYFPYARQDRYTSLGSSFSLKIATNFINSLNFSCVTVEDPHSVVLPTLLNNCRVINYHDCYVKANIQKLSDEDKHRVVILSPDAGAVKRATQVSESLNVRFALAHKKRDPATGKILTTEVFGGIQDNDIVYICDDICDGGRTFIELAKVLKSRYNGLTLKLFVTHGIFSKGMGVFEDFDEVYAHFNFWE